MSADESLRWTFWAITFTIVNMNGGYHLWRYDRRRRRLFMQTARARGRWDDGAMPAYWAERMAARKWGERHIGKGKFRVMACEGPELCGMIDHGDNLGGTFPPEQEAT